MNRISGGSHGGAEEREIAQMEAQCDDAVPLGERRLQMLPAPDVENAPQPFGIAHLHDTIEGVLHDSSLHTLGQAALGCRSVRIAEGRVHQGDDAPARYGAKDQRLEERRE